MECACSEIDEMDIDFIIKALECNQIIYESSQLCKFKEDYFPKLIAKLKRWKESREAAILNRFIGGVADGN